jgi:hypothetical protein
VGLLLLKRDRRQLLVKLVRSRGREGLPDVVREENVVT